MNKLFTTVGLVALLAATPSLVMAKTELHMIFCGQEIDPNAIVQTKHVREWEAANPDYTVKEEYLGWKDCQSKATTLAVAGNPAAIAYVGSRVLKSLASNDLIVPIPLAEEELSSYEASVRATVEFDGKLWGLPRAFSTKALFWNKDLFEKAGLPTDKAPATFAEVIAAAKAISEKTDAAGIGIPAADMDNTMHGFLNWMYSNGGQIIDKDGNITFNSPQVIETLQFYKDLAPYMQEGPLSYDRAELEPLFANAKIGMYINGGWGRAPSRVGSTKWAIAPIPKGPSGDHSTLLVTDSLVVFKSDVQEKALELVKYLTVPERQNQFDEAGGWTPIRLNAFSDSLIEKDPTWELFIKTIPTGGPEPLMTDYIATQDVINNAIQAVIEGDETPEEAAKTAAEELEELK